MQYHAPTPFKIPTINFLPEKAKPWLIIFFVIVFQFSGGGVYLAILNETVGARTLMLEDVLMAGFASLAGMSLVFTFMLRLKMRIPTKTAFLVSIAVLIICNIICLYTDNLFVLVGTCFIAGIFRMWATFECNSTIQLWITPNRDLPVFFCYINILVQGMLLLGGVGDMYVSFFTNWQYVHWIVILVLLFIMLLTILFFNNKRIMPSFPLYGIDWLGATLWGATLLTINFIAIYGEHYDWWYSTQIRIASYILIALLILNLYRASFIRHPFISLHTFKYKSVYKSVTLYIVIDILLAPSHTIEYIYFEDVLNYDSWHMMSLDLISWGGDCGRCIIYLSFFCSTKEFI